MGSTKYQSESDSIHIEMTCECVVFPQKIYIFMHVLPPFHATKSTRTFLLMQKNTHSGIVREIARYKSHRERFEYNADW